MEEVKFVQGEEAEEQLELVIRDLRTGEERTIKRDFIMLKIEDKKTEIIGNTNFSGLLNGLDTMVHTIAKTIAEMPAEHRLFAHLDLVKRLIGIKEVMENETKSNID